MNFPILVLYIANFLKGSLQDEADQLFQAIFKWDAPKAVVTRSAICQARKKIKHGVFIALRDAICGFLNLRGVMKTYKGYRLMAIDGSVIRPPNLPIMRTHFGQVKTSDGYRAMARASLLYDPLNRITCDAILANYHVGEQQLAWDHLETAALPQNCLFLMDRGYMSFQLLRHILDQGHEFLLRVKSNLNIVKQLNATGLHEGVFLLRPSWNAKAGIPKGSSLRQPMRVRVLKIDHSGTEPYYLVTSLLDVMKISRQELSDLYHQRWQVEESFKIKKCRLMIEEFSGTSPEVVLQDFHAKVFAECLTEALTLQVSEEVDDYSASTKGDYKVCFSQALAKMKNALVLLFIRPRVKSLISDLLAIFKKRLVAIVPGRKFKRKGGEKGRIKYKIAARAYRMNR